MKHNRVLLGFLAAAAAMMFLFCGDNIVKVPAGASGSGPEIDNGQDAAAEGPKLSATYWGLRTSPTEAEIWFNTNRAGIAYYKVGSADDIVDPKDIVKTGSKIGTVSPDDPATVSKKITVKSSEGDVVVWVVVQDSKKNISGAYYVNVPAYKQNAERKYNIFCDANGCSAVLTDLRKAAASSALPFSDADINKVIEAVRADAAGKNVEIAFEKNSKTLDVGTKAVSFVTTSGSWGEITFSGKITGSNASATSGVIVVGSGVKAYLGNGFSGENTAAGGNAVFVSAGGTLSFAYSDVSVTSTATGSGVKVDAGGTITGNVPDNILQNADGILDVDALAFSNASYAWIHSSGNWGLIPKTNGTIDVITPLIQGYWKVSGTGAWSTNKKSFATTATTPVTVAGSYSVDNWQDNLTIGTVAFTSAWITIPTTAAPTVAITSVRRTGDYGAALGLTITGDYNYDVTLKWSVDETAWFTNTYDKTDLPTSYTFSKSPELGIDPDLEIFVKVVDQYGRESEVKKIAVPQTYFSTPVISSPNLANNDLGAGTVTLTFTSSVSGTAYYWAGALDNSLEGDDIETKGSVFYVEPYDPTNPAELIGTSFSQNITYTAGVAGVKYMVYFVVKANGLYSTVGSLLLYDNSPADAEEPARLTWSGDNFDNYTNNILVSVSRATATTATAKFSSDQDGEAYYVDNDADKSARQIVSGGSFLGNVTAGTVNTIEFTGLAGTEHVRRIVVVKPKESTGSDQYSDVLGITVEALATPKVTVNALGRGENTYKFKVTPTNKASSFRYYLIASTAAAPTNVAAFETGYGGATVADELTVVDANHVYTISLGAAVAATDEFKIVCLAKTPMGLEGADGDITTEAIDEFEAPEIDNATAAVRVGDAKALVTLDANVGGSLYYELATSAPTDAATLVASATAAGRVFEEIAKDEVVEIPLPAATAYTAYFVLEDVVGNLSAISSDVTINAAPAFTSVTQKARVGDLIDSVEVNAAIGTLYYVVVDGDDAPTFTTLSTSSLTKSVTAANTATDFGLTVTAGEKDIYFILKTAAGDYSNTKSVTALEAPGDEEYEGVTASYTEEGGTGSDKLLTVAFETNLKGTVFVLVGETSPTIYDVMDVTGDALELDYNNVKSATTNDGDVATMPTSVHIVVKVTDDGVNYYTGPIEISGDDLVNSDL